MKKKHSLAGRVTVTATAAALLLSTFITPVSAAIERPFQSDTTMSVAVKGSYTFKITPNNPNAFVTAYTTDGSVFDTNVAGKCTSSSKASYYFKLIGKQTGSAGVYVRVGKTNYRVFTATTSVKKTDVPSSSQTAIVKLTSGYLNFRSSPSANGSVIGQLKNGESVTVLGISGGWTHVQTADGVKGYCCSDYLVAANDGSASAVSGSSKTLSGLPCYKQKDSRWANTYLGGSNGGTIGAIGCAVTCLAMSESYRTQKTVTPNMVKNQCQFTDGGGLYWPSNYSQDIVKNLADIYKCLKANKPVIVGGYSSRSSHWIIVKGYKNVPLDAHGNSTSLDASMFLINDPGYDSYTLADYISQFPYGRVYWTYSS